MFFFEKKNQKTLSIVLRTLIPREDLKRIKVFLLLFLQKKKTFLSPITKTLYAARAPSRPWI